MERVSALKFQQGSECPGGLKKFWRNVSSVSFVIFSDLLLPSSRSMKKERHQS